MPDAKFTVEELMRMNNYSSSHYVSKREGLEAIDVIEAFDLNRNLANVCKYILRCNHKGQRDSDLEKAINYLWRERYGTWLPSDKKDK